MKKFIAGCLTLIICVAIFAVPLYYQTFYKKTSDAATAIAGSASPDASALQYNDRYMVLASSTTGSQALVLDQKSSSVYLLNSNGKKLLYTMSY
jgi:hypothetical protein